MIHVFGALPETLSWHYGYLLDSRGDSQDLMQPLVMRKENISVWTSLIQTLFAHLHTCGCRSEPVQTYARDAAQCQVACL
jgi:hypothetical protein